MFKSSSVICGGVYLPHVSARHNHEIRESKPCECVKKCQKREWIPCAAHLYPPWNVTPESILVEGVEWFAIVMTDRLLDGKNGPRHAKVRGLGLQFLSETFEMRQVILRVLPFKTHSADETICINLHVSEMPVFFWKKFMNHQACQTRIEPPHPQNMNRQEPKNEKYSFRVPLLHWPFRRNPT